MRRFLVIAVIMGMVGYVMGQVETSKVELQEPATHVSDGLVYITRDSGGNLIFTDKILGALVTLTDLVTSATGVTEHSKLTGLGADDHTQYYNSSRLFTKLGSSAAGAIGPNPPHGRGADIPTKDKARIKGEIITEMKKLGRPEDEIKKDFPWLF